MISTGCGSRGSLAVGRSSTSFKYIMTAVNSAEANFISDLYLAGGTGVYFNGGGGHDSVYVSYAIDGRAISVNPSACN